MGEERRISVTPVLLINFVGTLGYSIILPFLVFLVTRFEGNGLVYGLLGATYPAFQLIGGPVLGRWSDVHGRKQVLFLSQLGTLLAWVGFAVALFLPTSVVLEVEGSFVLTLPVVALFAARALDGLTGGNISVANAYLADITDEADRSANFGKMAVSSNLGFVVGPALAGLLGGTLYGELLPVLAALAISVLATLLVARLREPDPCQLDPGAGRTTVRKVFGMELKDCVRVRDAEPLTSSGVLRIPGMPHLLVLYFLVFLGFNLFYTAFPVHAVRTLEWTIRGTGTFFAALSLSMVVVQGPILARVSKRFTEPVLILVGNLVLGTSFVLLTRSDLPSIAMAVALFALGNGVMWPSVLSVLSKCAGAEHQGAVQGHAGSVAGLASIVGLVAGGLLYESIGIRTFFVSATAIYVAALMSGKLLSGRREGTV